MMDTLNNLYFVAVPIALLLYFWNFPRYIRQHILMRDIPSSKGLPIIGSAYEVICYKADIFRICLRRCSNRAFSMVQSWLLNQPYLYLYTAKAFQDVLTSKTTIVKSKDYKFALPWLGEGLITVNDASKWFRQRRQLTPAFHFKILESHIKVLNEQSRILLEQIDVRTSQSSGPIAVVGLVSRCTLSIICETAMGKQINAQQETDSEYIKAIYRISELIVRRQIRPWIHSDFIYNLTAEGREHKKLLRILHTFTDNVIKERKIDRVYEKNIAYLTDVLESNEGDNKKKLAFLDLLLDASEEEGGNISDTELRSQVDTIMFAGHDTTTLAITWCLFLLGNNPECQEKVYEELQAVFGDSNRDITKKDLLEMKYLEMCVKEALRLYPSVPMIARQMVEDTIINGHKIPKGVVVMLVIYALHRDPEVFPNPEMFDPERFSTENVIGRHAFAYVPFSGGLRNCIGQKFAMMEEKMILANILRCYKVISAEKAEDVFPQFGLVLRPTNDLKMTFIKRSPHCDE